MHSVCLLLLVSVAVFAVAQEIVNLPGAPSVSFKQYAGYINVNATTGRNLFYWFVEAQTNPESAPVALWLNGGPGCSSLGGFFEELGPFIPNPDGKTLSVNPYSWNKVANVIFLESPSGVGFSYSTDTNDYNVGDVRTANDSYTFLLEFFKQYPQFAKNPFWVTGESYGGHYVPNLARRILQGNKENPSQTINIQGFLAGNPWTDADIDNWGAAYYWFTHALVSEDTYKGILDYCNLAGIGPLTPSPDPVKCNSMQNQAFNEMGNIDIYDVYYDVCLSESNSGLQLMKALAKSPSRMSTMAQRMSVGYAPCVDSYLGSYLNTPSVKKAIHANPAINWTGCSSVVNYSYTDLLTSMLPVYQELIATNNLRILVYSGDVDAIVPVTGTRRWISALNLTVTSPWAPWTDPVGQVAGYTTGYKGLTFTTVRGAGHLVPGTQPVRALAMFSDFTSNTPF